MQRKPYKGYNVGQAKKHLKHHKGTKMLKKQIEAQKERTEKED